MGVLETMNICKGTIKTLETMYIGSVWEYAITGNLYTVVAHTTSGDVVIAWNEGGYGRDIVALLDTTADKAISPSQFLERISSNAMAVCSHEWRRSVGVDGSELTNCIKCAEFYIGRRKCPTSASNTEVPTEFTEKISEEMCKCSFIGFGHDVDCGYIKKD